MGAHTKSSRGAGRGAADVTAVLDGVRRIVREIRVSARAAERRVGVSGAQLFVLQKLADGGPAASLNELAERTRTHQSSVSVVVARLVERGLVARTAAAGDARRLELSLTPAGRALLRAAPGAAQERLIAALERMPAAERRHLARGLARLVEELGGAGEGPAPMFFEDEEGAAGAPRPARSRGRAKPEGGKSDAVRRGRTRRDGRG